MRTSIRSGTAPNDGLNTERRAPADLHRDVVDEEVGAIRSRFGDQPEVQATLYGIVGKFYGDLGANEEAIDLAKLELQALDKLPPDTTRRVRALLSMARAMHECVTVDA